jgi:hypothetical protein
MSFHFAAFLSVHLPRLSIVFFFSHQIEPFLELTRQAQHLAHQCDGAKDSMLWITLFSDTLAGA